MLLQFFHVVVCHYLLALPDMPPGMPDMPIFRQLLRPSFFRRQSLVLAIAADVSGRALPDDVSASTFTGVSAACCPDARDISAPTTPRMPITRHFSRQHKRAAAMPRHFDVISFGAKRGAATADVSPRAPTPPPRHAQIRGAESARAISRRIRRRRRALPPLRVAASTALRRELCFMAATTPPYLRHDAAICFCAGRFSRREAQAPRASQRRSQPRRPPPICFLASRCRRARYGSAMRAP